MHVLIEMRPKGSTAWEVLGRFRSTATEIEALRAVLAAHGKPYDALPHLPKGLVWDTLDICQREGHEVRVTFREEDA
jgi:hypothetical protein